MRFDGNLYVENNHGCAKVPVCCAPILSRRIKRPRNRSSPTFSNRKDLQYCRPRAIHSPVVPFTMGRVFWYPGQTRIHKEVSDTPPVPRSRGTSECECRLAVVRLSVFPSRSRETTSRAFVIVVSAGCSWLACREKEEKEEKEEDFFRDAYYFAPTSRGHHAAEDNFCSYDNRFGESHDIASGNRREWDGMSQFRIFRDLKWIRWPPSIYSG